MNLISAYKPTHKIVCLSSVSQGAVFSLIETQSYLSYTSAPDLVAAPYENQRTPSGVWVFLTWLRIWLNWVRGQKYIAGAPKTHKRAFVNRHYKRMAGRKIPPARSFKILFHLYGKTRSWTQFLELMCKLMPLGRVCIYSMCFWGSVLQRRALLICYDHGWWRTPLCKMGLVNGGLWCVHLWPN